MNDKRINQAVNFETLLLASKENIELVNELYTENKDELSSSSLINFSKFSKLLSVSSDKLSNIYFKVSDSFSRLPDGYEIISADDSQWPTQLEDLEYCPKFLYYKGNIDLLNKTVVSIVGTKSPTDGDKIIVEQTVETFVKNEIIVASGLTLGVEGLASAVSCTHFAPTIAVLGTSLETYYPEGHKKMQDYIANEGGLIITMTPPCAPPQNFKFNFLLRNRLLSALSDAIVIIDDIDRGGSIKMAEAALENKKKVFFYSALLKRNNLSWPKRLKEMTNVFTVRYPGNLVNILLENKNKSKSSPKEKKEKIEKGIQLTLF
jgi:DNA processing protein